MNGILVVDKSIGYTSRDIVNIVSKKIGTRKIGHTGTLDPLASGVLVLCIGKALKVVELVTGYDKKYIARVRLGYETDTLDSEGKILYKDKYKDFTCSDIDKVLESYVGCIKQEVPKYSSIKVNGKKLYEYARNGIDVELPVREVNIYSIERISDIENVDNYLEFSICCHVSKGTYIRSLVRDIGHSLGSYATMVGLRRISQGNFKIDNAYTMDDIENGNYQIKSISDVLDMNRVIVDNDMEFKIRSGQVLDKFFNDNKVLIVNKDNEVIAIYEQSVDNKVKPWKVLV